MILLYSRGQRSRSQQAIKVVSASMLMLFEVCVLVLLSNDDILWGYM